MRNLARQKHGAIFNNHYLGLGICNLLLRPIMNIPSNYVRNITPATTNCFDGVKI